MSNAGISNKLTSVVNEKYLMCLPFLLVNSGHSHSRNAVHLRPAQMTNERIPIQTARRSNKMTRHA